MSAAAGEVEQSALSDLPRADVYLLGEVHDNPAHHLNQAQALRHLAPKAVVFEMLTPQQAEASVGVDRQDAAALGAALGWADSGWPDFALYAQVFAATGDALIFGAALPQDQVRLAVSQGAASIFGDWAARYGLTEPVPEPQLEARLTLQREAHCNALPEALLPGMVEAQRLRDAALARVIDQAHTATGGPVAVIVGIGHVRRDWGIPAKLARAAPELVVFALAQVEDGVVDETLWDAYLRAAPAPREDPCAVFQKS